MFLSKDKKNKFHLTVIQSDEKHLEMKFSDTNYENKYLTMQ